jgi:hypothetical protein
MNGNDRLRRYLNLCRRLYERMRRNGTWPWEVADDADKGAPERPQREKSISAE